MQTRLTGPGTWNPKGKRLAATRRRNKIRNLRLFTSNTTAKSCQRQCNIYLPLLLAIFHARAGTSDDEVLKAAREVLAFKYQDFEDLVDELRRDLQAERRERRRSELLNADLVGLLIEVGEESRRRDALHKMRRQLERREAEYSLPSYFWRPEKNRTTKQMLFWRAQFLIRKGAGVADLSAFLTEYNEDCSGAPVTADELKQIILEARNANVS